MLDECIGYPINKNIKMYGIATIELSANTFVYWEKTCKYYGYDYELLGRDKHWTGYGCKVKIFYDALLQTKSKYVVLMDTTDAFLCGSSDELYEKLSKQNSIIISGEMWPYYPSGKHDINKLKEHFEKIKESPQCYPNSGFIAGKTKEVLQLIKLHLGYHDDQVACFDTIYENKIPIKIDYFTEFMGNVPNYFTNRHISQEYFIYDTELQRYKSKLHNTCPIALHFPGKNRFTMHDFFYISHRFLAEPSGPSNSVGYVILVTLLTIFLLCLLSYKFGNYLI